MKETYDNVKLGVDVNEFAVLVNDGQSWDSLVDEFSQGFDDWRRVVGNLDVFVRPDVQFLDRLVQIVRFRKVVDLKKIDTDKDMKPINKKNYFWILALHISKE